jgi:hypothetical protein
MTTLFQVRKLDTLQDPHVCSKMSISIELILTIDMMRLFFILFDSCNYLWKVSKSWPQENVLMLSTGNDKRSNIQEVFTVPN